MNQFFCFKTLLIYFAIPIGIAVVGFMWFPVILPTVNAIFHVHTADSQEPNAEEKFRMTTNVLWEQKQKVAFSYAVAISPDETTCAVLRPAENDRYEVRIIELKNGKLLRTIPIGKRKDIGGCEFEYSPDGTRLVFVDPAFNKLLIIDPLQGKVLHTVVHNAGLYSPRFRRLGDQQQAEQVLCFSGWQTFTIVSVNLVSGDVTPFFDLLDVLSDTDIAEGYKDYGHVFYAARDFMADENFLYIGLRGAAMSFDIKSGKRIWRVALCNTDSVIFHRIPENTETALVYCYSKPNIREINLADGQIRNSLDSPKYILIGQQNGRLLTLDCNGIKLPSRLRAVEFNSDWFCEQEISKTGLGDRFDCSVSGKFLLFVESSGVVKCVRILIQPVDATEPIVEPKCR